MSAIAKTTLSANWLDKLDIDHDNPATWPVIVINNTKGEAIWESKAPDFKVAVEEAMKHGADLTKADFSRLDLFETRFTRGVNLSGADFSHCRLDRASFDGVNLSNTTFDYAHLFGVQFTNCDISMISLSNAWLTEYTVFCDTMWHGICAENVVPILGLLARRVVVSHDTLVFKGNWTHETQSIVNAQLLSADELLAEFGQKAPKHFKKHLPVFGPILAAAFIRALQYEKARHAPQVAA